MTALLCTPATLKALPLLSSFDEEAIERALPHLHVRTYPDRTLISLCDATVDSLCLILAGRVRVMRHDETGREAVLEELREHEFFNELGWLEGCTSGEQYAAATPCTIAHVPRRLVEDWLLKDLQTAQFIMRVLAARLANARRRIASLALGSVQKRVVDALLERAHEENGQWIVDVGSEFIAVLVGASREMVSRVVTELVGRGLVRRHKRKIIVVSRSRLADYASTRSSPRACASALKVLSEPSALLTPRRK